MKPHPRIRKTIKWGGAAVTVLLVVVWIGSGWWGAGADISGNMPVALYRGAFYASTMGGSTPGVAYGLVDSPHYVWTPFYAAWAGDHTINLPLWIFAGPFVVITALAWLIDARVT